MKNTLKTRIFSVIVTMVLVLSLAVPTQAMAAAAKITQKNGNSVPSTIYTKQSYTLKVSGTTVKFYSSNKKVATITTSGKLTAKAPGTVKISAKNKKGKVIATKTLKVNQRCTKITSNIPELTLIAGETAKLSATKTPRTSTDVVRYYSNNKSIATVNSVNGTVTAVAAGTTTIKIVAKATKSTSNSSKSNKVTTVNVTVKEAVAPDVTITSVQQTELNKLRLTYTGTPSAALVPQEFIIVNPKTFETPIVTSAVLVPAEQNGVNYIELTTSTEMKDSKEYTVTYHKSTVSFTATDGKAANYLITPLKVEVNVPTPIYLNVLDSKNIVIYKGLYNAKNAYNITCALTCTDGSETKDGLVLYSTTSTAKMEITQHTNTYDKAGKEITKTATVVLQPVAGNTPSTGVTYHIGKTNEVVDFNKAGFKGNNTITVGDTTQSLFVNLENCLGQAAVDYSKYTVESSDNSMLIISGKLVNKATGLNVVAMKEGNCNIFLKDAAGKVVKTYPITITKTREAAQLSFDNAAPFLNATSIAGTATNVTVSVLDQYNVVYPDFDTSKLSIKCTKSSSNLSADTINKNLKDYVTLTKNVLAFSPVKTPVGFYVYTVSYNKIQKEIVVTVKQPEGTPSYTVSVETEIVKLPSNTIDTSSIIVPIYVTYNVGNVAVSKTKINENADITVTVTDLNGKDVTADYYKDGCFVAQRLDGKNLIQAPMGPYTIKATLKAPATTAINTARVVVMK